MQRLQCEVSILVVSCDRYADLWTPFFSLLNRYWPDCPYPIYLGANYYRYSSEKVQTILIGKDNSWADSTKRIVEQIESPYILMLLEDFFLRSSVDTASILNCVSALQNLKGGYLRLKPFPRPDSILLDHPKIGEIKREAPYRAALQAAIWRKDTLIALLQEGESAWDFERLSSWRSNYLKEGFFCTWRPVLNYYPVVTQGKWVPQGIRICQQEKLVCDLLARPKMTTAQVLVLYLRKIYGRIIDIVPWTIRRRTANWLRQNGILGSANYQKAVLNKESEK